MMECDHIVNEVRGCLRDVRHWMKPRPKRKQLANALDGVMVGMILDEVLREEFSVVAAPANLTMFSLSTKFGVHSKD